MTNSIAESQIAVLSAINECSDYDKDGLCGSGAKIEGLTCVDVNHDLYCDWFRPATVNTTKPIPDVSHLKEMTVKACPEPSPDSNAVFEKMCDWYANGTIVWTPKPVLAPMTQLTKSVDKRTDCYEKGLREWTAGTSNQSGFDSCGPEYFKAIRDSCLKWNDKTVCDAWYPTSTPVQTQNLVCQSNDDFCTPGCEHADMQCIGEGNDDNRNGVKDSEENQGSNQGSSNNNNNNRNDDKDIKYCKGQQAPQYPNSCYDRNDLPDNDLPNCNDVEYGTRCDGSEDEYSWTDEEAGGN